MSKRRIYGMLGNTVVGIGGALAVSWGHSPWWHGGLLLCLFVAANVLGHGEGLERGCE